MLRCSALVLVFASVAASAAEVHVSFAALERMLAAQLFTDQGRRYVRGSRTEKCNYAWLEGPQVRGSNGRLLIRARFTGRTSLDVFGRCIGLGDSFGLTLTATPFYAAGQVGLKHVEASPEGGGGFYANRVCAALSGSLERDFRYPLAAEAKRGLEDPGAQPQYARQLRRFNVTGIRVTDEALVFDMDFAVFVQ